MAENKTNRLIYATKKTRNSIRLFGCKLNINQSRNRRRKRFYRKNSKAYIITDSHWLSYDHGELRAHFTCGNTGRVGSCGRAL